MKDLTVFHETYKFVLNLSGSGVKEAFESAKYAQLLFDEYIAEQIEASKLKPVDAETAMPNITEAISSVERKPFEPMFEEANNYTKEELENIEANLRPQDQPQKFYWKPVSEFTEEDAYRDSDNILIAQYSRGAVDFFTSFDDMNTDSVGVTKYLARCKEDKGESVPCLEWTESSDKDYTIALDGALKACKGGDGTYYFIFNTVFSHIYPNQEAAQHEAERYYNLYVKNK